MIGTLPASFPVLTDEEVRSAEKQGDAAGLAAYFWTFFLTGTEDEKRIAARQFEEVLTPSFREIVNVS